MEVRGGNIVEQRGEKEIMSDEGERADKGALEAMGRDGFLDLAQSEWRGCVWHSLNRALLPLQLGATRHWHPATSSHRVPLKKGGKKQSSVGQSYRYETLSVHILRN